METDVYFDDMTVTHEKLVPDDKYDPDLLAYRYGFNGKEKDQSGEWGLNAYDYGFRIYNPALGRFLSVDPLTRNFPWNSPYSYAENDVIRSIDLDGLEKVAVTESPVNAGRIRSLFEVKNYRKIYEIIEYSSTHGWVNSEGKPSDYIERKYVEQHGDKGPGISKGSSAMVFNDLYVDEGLVEEFGDINDHGGYMKVQFFNWETNEYESLGTLPLSKVNENQKTRIVGIDGIDNIESTFNTMDGVREIGQRGLNHYLEIIGVILNTSNGPPDIEALELEKAKFELQGRLRTLGPNSAFETAVPDKSGYGTIGTYRMEYQIDKKGNESFNETFKKKIQ